MMWRYLLLLPLVCFMAMPAGAMTITNFHAELRSENVISGGSQASTETAVGTATFTLTEFVGNPSATTLSYDITLNFLDLDGVQTGASGDNVTAIHFHDLKFFANNSPNTGSDTQGTRHVLNVFGLPRQDDANMTFDVANGMVSGLWDDGDENLNPPGPSVKISDVITELKAGELFVMVHTNDFPSGAIGGAIVPEPTTWTLAVAAFAIVAVLVAGRRFSRRSTATT